MPQVCRYQRQSETRCQSSSLGRYYALRMKMDVCFVVLSLFCVNIMYTIPHVDASVDAVEQQQVDHFDTVSEDKLRDMVQKQNYVVALLIGGGCKTKESVEAEAELAKIRSDLEDQFSAPIVKLSSKALVKQYGVHQVPSVLFFRDGNAVIYDGPFYDESLFEWFLQNSEPSVKKLTEETFEHLTQASTGATTGDWFIVFCNESSVSCQRLQPSWESVAGRMKMKMNIALVDSANSPGLTKRFRIEKDPELIYFCLGKMYRYTLTKYDIPSLSGFAMGWFTNVRAEPVPQQETPFDNLISFIVKKIKSDLRDPYVISPLMMLTLPLAIVIFAIYSKGRDIKLVD